MSDLKNLRAIFERRFDEQCLDIYYGELVDRETNPEHWDSQLKFWKGIILAWENTGVCFAKISDLEEVLSYNQIIPPIRNCLLQLLNEKIIALNSDLSCQKRFIQKICAKIYGKVIDSNDIIIFLEKFKEFCKDYVSERVNSAYSIQDCVYTYEEVEENIEPDLRMSFRRTLENMGYVGIIKEGGYFLKSEYSQRFTNDVWSPVLTAKKCITSITKELEKIENVHDKYIQRAREVARQGKSMRNNRLLNMYTREIRRMKIFINQLDSLRIEYMKYLDRLNETHSRSQFVDLVNEFNGKLKTYQIQYDRLFKDADRIIDNFEDGRYDFENINDELAGRLNAYSEDVDNTNIDNEINNLIYSNNPIQKSTYSLPFQTGPFSRFKSPKKTFSYELKTDSFR